MFPALMFGWLILLHELNVNQYSFVFISLHTAPDSISACAASPRLAKKQQSEMKENVVQF